jgi:hypothetical protein
MYFMRKLQGLIVVAILLMAASIAQAAPVPGGALDSYLTGIGINNLDVTNALNPSGSWHMSEAATSLLLHNTSGTTGAVFGIYDYATGTKLTIFDGSAVGSRRLEFTIEGNIRVMDYISGTILGEAAVGYDNFGFFVDGYTNDSGNVLAYKGTGERYNSSAPVEGFFTTDQYLLAWDLGVLDGDYADYLVTVQSMEPNTPAVPEPSSVLLLGGGLIGLGIASYRKIRK